MLSPFFAPQVTLGPESRSDNRASAIPVAKVSAAYCVRRVSSKKDVAAFVVHAESRSSAKRRLQPMAILSAGEKAEVGVAQLVTFYSQNGCSIGRANPKSPHERCIIECRETGIAEANRECALFGGTTTTLVYYVVAIVSQQRSSILEC